MNTHLFWRSLNADSSEAWARSGKAPAASTLNAKLQNESEDAELE